MIMRAFVFAVLSLALLRLAAEPVASGKKASAAEIGTVRLKGYLGERLDAMIRRHVCGTDVDYITAPFMEKTETKGWWQTEFWGKWMHSAVPYAAYENSEALRGKIERGIDRMLASQEPRGRIRPRLSSATMPRPVMPGAGTIIIARGSRLNGARWNRVVLGKGREGAVEAL